MTVADKLIQVYGIGMLVFGIATACIVGFDLLTGRWKRFCDK